MGEGPEEEVSRSNMKWNYPKWHCPFGHLKVTLVPMTHRVHPHWAGVYQGQSASARAPAHWSPSLTSPLAAADEVRSPTLAAQSVNIRSVFLGATAAGPVASPVPPYRLPGAPAGGAQSPQRGPNVSRWSWDGLEVRVLWSIRETIGREKGHRKLNGSCTRTRASWMKDANVIDVTEV